MNEASYNYNGNRLIFSPVGTYKKPAGWGIPELFPSNADNRLPTVNIAGAYGTNYDPGSWPWYNAADSNEVRDDLSWTVGNHNMKMGANFLRYRKNQDIFGDTQGSFNFNGSFTGDAFADFLLGYANSYNELDIERSRPLARHHGGHLLCGQLAREPEADPEPRAALGSAATDL